MKDSAPITGSLLSVEPAAKVSRPQTAANTIATHTAALKNLLLQNGNLSASDVRIIDWPNRRIHHPNNLLQMLGAVIGIALTLLFAVYAHGTALGLTADLRGLVELLSGIFFLPVNVLEGIITLIVPVMLVIELGIRHQIRTAIEALAAAVLSFGAAFGIAWLLAVYFRNSALTQGLSIVVEQQWQLSIPEYLAALAAMLIVAGPGSKRRTVRWSWRLLIVTVLIFVIGGAVSAPGTIFALLLGTLIGHIIQYTAGVQSERAYGVRLVAAIERAGWRPAALVRVTDLGQPAELGQPTDLAFPPEADLAVQAVASSSDSGATALARSSATRVYAMLDRAGERFDVEVLDGDRQVPSLIQRLWRFLRLRDIGTRAALTLRAVTERVSLLSLSATAAGVRTPQLLGVGMDGDSAALVLEHVRGAVAWRDLDDDELAGPLGTTAMVDAWQQIRKAHRAGLAHHHITSDVLLISRDDDDYGSQAWITGWDQGEIAASTLAKRLDLVQLLTLFALRVGPEHATAVAEQCLSESDLAALSPLIQAVALPAETKAQLRGHKKLLTQIRTGLLERLPQVDSQTQTTQPITRFSVRTIITLALTIVAVAVVITTVNLGQIQAAISEANPWWIAVSFGFGVLTWLGGAMALQAYSPVKLKFGKTILAQMAGSFVALATPAGIGPAALNLRYLSRQGLTVPMAVASVALMQAAQFVITVILLVVIALATGSGGLITLPSGPVMLAVALIVGAIVVLMLIPATRNWAWGKVGPTLRQLWPRLSAMLAQPSSLLLGIGGNILISAGFVLSFYAALRAFALHMHAVDVAIIYLVGAAVGALVPTPGGVGGIEGALIAGLSAAGVAVALATPATLLFRLVTYWLRVPIGWVAMKYLESRHDI